MTWHLIDDPDNQPPKDGTEILLADSYSISVGQYARGSWIGRIGGWPIYNEFGEPVTVSPTHWAPMLPPPDTQG